MKEKVANEKIISPIIESKQMPIQFDGHKVKFGIIKLLQRIKTMCFHKEMDYLNTPCPFERLRVKYLIGILCQHVNFENQLN